MTTGFRNSAGVDFDSLFDPYVSGAKSVTSGLRLSNGVDLRERFAPIAVGSKGANVGFRTASGVDVSNLWAAKGSASYNDAVVIPFGSYVAEAIDSHDAGSSMSLTLQPSGSWSIALSTTRGSPTGTPTSGSWHKAPVAGVGDAYEVRFVASVTVQDSYSGSATPYYSPSTGWLRLNAARYIEARTDLLLGGGTGSGAVEVSGSYSVQIRKIGESEIRSSVFPFTIRAEIF